MMENYPQGLGHSHFGSFGSEHRKIPGLSYLLLPIIILNPIFLSQLLIWKTKKNERKNAPIQRVPHFPQKENHIFPIHSVVLFCYYRGMKMEGYGVRIGI